MARDNYNRLFLVCDTIIRRFVYGEMSEWLKEHAWPPPEGGVPPQAEKAYNSLVYQVYILCSLSKKRYYIGHTNDIERRLVQHNSGATRSTKAYAPWSVIYTEPYETKQLAYAREMQIKSYKGGRAFRVLLEQR